MVLGCPYDGSRSDKIPTMNEIIQTIAVYALPVLFAITLHEAAHAYAAKYFGDLTAYSQGRMSLNPAKHIDPLGTVLIPVLLALISSPFFVRLRSPGASGFCAASQSQERHGVGSACGSCGESCHGLVMDGVIFRDGRSEHRRDLFL